MTKMTRNIPLFIVAVFLIVQSCSKGPGPGGTSTIRGDVWVRDYNQSFTTLWATYWGADRDVYLIYGDNETYSDHVKTGPDGDFEFSYLTKGDYTVYVYSKDSTLQSPSGQIAIKADVTISENKQIVQLPTIRVYE
jgi:hypothetical protein